MAARGEGENERRKRLNKNPPAFRSHELDWAAGPQFGSPSGRTRSPSFWSTGAGVAADNSISSGGECGLAYKLLPSGAATPSAPYFAYAAGLLTVVSASSELDLSAGSPQGTWLRATLAAVNRRATPFVVLFMHRSPYVKPTSKAGAWPSYDPRFAGDLSGMLYFSAVLEPLLLQFGVDLVYSGHTHVTQRACATVNFTCAQRPAPSASGDGFVEYAAPAAPVYYVVGNLGANTDSVNTNAPPPWLDFESDAFAYARIVVRSATVLEVSLVDIFSGAVIDRSRIVKAAQPAPAASAAGGKKDDGAAIGGAIAGVLVLGAVGIWAAGNARVRGLFGKAAYAHFHNETANPAASPRASPRVLVVVPDGAAAAGGPADAARRARVASARALGAA